MALWNSKHMLRLVLIGVLSIAGATSLLTMIHASAQPATLQQLAVAGTYKGNVSVSEPAPLGALTLALGISNDGGVLSGDVDPTQTMVFLGGPSFTGQVTEGKNPTFEIESEIFTSIVSNRTVQRSFTLKGEVLDNGNSLQGDYVETISGFTPTPMVVKGTFLLLRPLNSQIIIPPQVGGTPTPTSTPIGTKPTATPPSGGGNDEDVTLRLPVVRANQAAIVQSNDSETQSSTDSEQGETVIQLPMIKASQPAAAAQATPGYSLYLPTMTNGE